METEWVRRLWKLRSRIRDRASAELAEQEQHLAMARNAVVEAERNVELRAAAMNSLEGSPAEIEMTAQALREAVAARNKAEARMKQEAEERDRRQAVLVELHREARALEISVENAEREDMRQADRREQKIADDRVAARGGRNR